MVLKVATKKDIIDELKRYNKDLETHLPNLDLDFVNDLKPSKNSSENDEYFSLLANNLMELRTEIALTRKNLSTEIEGMLLRSINEEQNKFFDQIKKFYGVIILELKENFVTHLKKLNDDINDMKRKHVEISLQNENFSNQMNNLITDVKSMRNQIDDSASENTEAQVLAKKQWEVISTNLQKIANNMGSNEMYIEDNLMKLNKKFARIELLLDEIKVDESLSSGVNFKERTKFDDIDDDLIDEIKVATINKRNNDRDNDTYPSSKLQKIIDINEKLERLNSLK